MPWCFQVSLRDPRSKESLEPSFSLSGSCRGASLRGSPSTGSCSLLRKRGVLFYRHVGPHLYRGEGRGRVDGYRRLEAIFANPIGPALLHNSWQCHLGLADNLLQDLASEHLRVARGAHNDGVAF